MIHRDWVSIITNGLEELSSMLANNIHLPLQARVPKNMVIDVNQVKGFRRPGRVSGIFFYPGSLRSVFSSRPRRCLVNGQYT